MDTFGLSDVGKKRKRNEDNFLIKDLKEGGSILVVADGMGGAAAGNLASETVVTLLNHYPKTPGKAPEKQLGNAILSSARVLARITKKYPALAGMGSTASTVFVQKRTAYYAHVGDSRIYHFRDGKLNKVTKDHTYLQTFVDNGTMTQEEVEKHPFRNVLEQCVGCTTCDPSMGKVTVKTGDVLLLCSDGLYNEVPEEDISKHMSKGKNAKEIVEPLVKTAVKNGGRDNVTVVVAKF